MVGSTYVSESKRVFKSKYHGFTKQIEYSYRHLHSTVIFKFYRENIELNKIKDSLNKLLEKSKSLPFNNLDSIESVSLANKISTKVNSNRYKENIDWTRGRFRGEVLQIIVSNGQIVEKVFVTPRGKIIVVKRKDLGILARFSMKI